MERDSKLSRTGLCQPIWRHTSQLAGIFDYKNSDMNQLLSYIFALFSSRMSHWNVL